MRPKVLWITLGWVAVTFIMWKFLYARMPRQYYIQLHVLAHSHNTFANLPWDFYIAYRVIGWIFTMSATGFLFVGTVAILLMTTRCSSRTKLAGLYKAYTAKFLGVIVLALLILAYLFVSGTIAQLFIS